MITNFRIHISPKVGKDEEGCRKTMEIYCPIHVNLLYLIHDTNDEYRRPTVF